MPFKGSSRGEFSQLVSYHILGDEDRYMPPSVMHSDGESQHLRDDGAGTGPCLDDRLLPRLAGRLYLLHKPGIDIGAFLYRPSHYPTFSV